MGLRREEQFGHDADEPFSGFRHGVSDMDDEADFLSFQEMAPPPGPSGRLPWLAVARATIVMLALGWVCFAAWLYAAGVVSRPALDQLPLTAAGLCAPLILLGILYLLLLRGSVGEADRFAGITARLRREAEALDMRLAIVNQQLETARQTMSEQAALLEDYGGSASLNLEAAARTMAQQVDTVSQQAETIERAGLSLAHQFGQLVEAMPDLGARADHVSATLTESGAALSDKVEKLEARLDSLGRLLDEARTRTTSTTQSMTAQLMRIQDAARSASDEVAGMGEVAAGRVDATIERAHRVIADTMAALEAQTAQLEGLVEQSRSAFDGIGGDAVRSYGANIARIEGQLHEFDRMVHGQSEVIAGAGDDMARRIEVLREEFSALETLAVSGTERMAAALDALTRRTTHLDDALQSGNRTAEATIARAESLLVALDASVRELDEGHPAALNRFNERIEGSRKLLGVILPEIEKLEAISAAVLGQARESEEMLSGQGRRLQAWLDSGEASLSTCRQEISGLQQAMEAADTDARRLADSAGPQLIATLLRVKDVAEQAGERARQALARAIADATDELGDASERVISERIGEQFQARIAELGAVAERAVQSAHAASERLMRQLITIADTTGAIEQRFAEADEAVQHREQDTLARQSAALIESLHSISIDVTSILASDVGDASWAAYLEGDRGVFSRQAVRLVDARDAQSIRQLYRTDDIFRSSVNRYVHDFEAMLRTVLATREGTPLAVTLLSSDIGKLYVALAQAIERLKDG